MSVTFIITYYYVLIAAAEDINKNTLVHVCGVQTRGISIVEAEERQL